ncbi:MAG: methyltransferase domain-containing protein [Saprospiraceae bacterium]|nr:methyltransferase domain-containing protein [Saprospiraceae bacterium]
MARDQFSPLAHTYDAAFTETLVGRMQRQIVWNFLDKLLGKRSLRVLEINCGTGEDACWLARRGCSVLATDASAAMVAAARDKAATAGLNIETRVCDFAGLAQLPERDFDLVLSNFGGLNCIPPDELAALWPVLLDKLRPGGHLVAVLMGRFCWWESVYFLIKGQWRQAFRRWSGGPVTASLDGVSSVETWYASPDCSADLQVGEPEGSNHPRLSAKARIRNQPASHSPQSGKSRIVSSLNIADLEVGATAVGFWLPPSYLNPFFERRPRLLRLLFWLEKRCRGNWWARGADHFLICCSAP